MPHLLQMMTQWEQNNWSKIPFKYKMKKRNTSPDNTSQPAKEGHKILKVVKSDDINPKQIINAMIQVMFCMF